LNGIFCPLRKKLSLGFLIRALIIATAGGKRLGRNTCILIAFFTFFSIGLGVIWYTSQLHLKTQNSEETVYTQANSYEDRISQVAAQVSPSIVGISNLSRSKDIFSQNLVESTGSGVILDQEGYIVTNNHVVRGAYTGEAREVIMTILSRRDFIQLRDYIKKLDPQAFISVQNTHEVLGEGFRALE
jgi:uncharacterized membrane-anchored protein YitT (DUF2179 family)